LVTRRKEVQILLKEAAHGRYAALLSSERGRKCTPVGSFDRSITCKGIKNQEKRNPTERWWGFLHDVIQSGSNRKLTEKRDTGRCCNPLYVVADQLQHEENLFIFLVLVDTFCFVQPVKTCGHHAKTEHHQNEAEKRENY
jgi:hypothetical protein